MRFDCKVVLRVMGGAGLLVALGLAPFTGDAQQATKMPRVGVLRLGSPPDPYVDAFRRGLRDLGYVEGRTIRLEYRWAEGKPARLPALAGELVQLKVDVIVTQGEEATRAAKEATSTIPIVMASSGDPVVSGLVASLARPGGNVTGLSTLAPEIIKKQLQLLKEALPKVSRVAILSIPGNLALVQSVKEAREVAQTLGLIIQVHEVRAVDELGAAFDAMKRERADALFLFADAFTVNYQQQIFDLATKRRLPTTCASLESTDCLLIYGTSRLEMFRLAATYVDKILKGAKPADLPVEQATRFELIVNVKTAKALGITIPRSILGRADRIIQ